MKIRSLYLRILKHWIAALIATELLIFALFVLVIGDSHRQYVIRSVGQSTLVAADFVTASLALEQARGGRPEAALAPVLARLALRGNARVWVTGPGGELLGASFPGSVPTPVSDPAKSGQHEGVTVATDPGAGVPWYAVAPLGLPGPGGPLKLHLLSQQSAGAFPGGKFAAGLALIGGFIAMLAVPLTLRITRPLNRLQESALRIARGDLSARAELSGQDEIGRLAEAFNTMAETVERMVQGGKELTANVSHELRSPLARIRVAGECLREAVARGKRGEADEMLEAIREDIEEADRLLARILQFSKLDLQHPLAKAQEVAPGELIAGLVKTLGPLAKSRELTMQVTLLREEKVEGDPEALRAAFKNLLENALRHSAPGGEVKLEMRREESLLVVEVTNPHAPMEQAELEMIFRPFYRGKGSAGEGTGLGLAIARKVVALHGGEIVARNAKQGFQVRVALPAQG